MLKSLQGITLSFLVFFSAFCMKKSGGFAFHAVNDSKFTPLQKMIYLPRQFTKYQNPIQFNENLNIWFTYEPSKHDYHQPYAVSLSRKSLGWIEIDLKNLHLSNKIGYLVNNYPELKHGQYLLTVALENKILSSVEFEIIKEGDQRNDYIDYDLPLSVVLDSEADDLRVLSRD